MIKTQDEIVKHYRTTKDEDFFGFAGEVFIPYLDFQPAREFLKPDTSLTAESWKQYPLTEEGVIGEMKSYMEFAWDKASNHRGLSAGRSVEKMRAWLWLLGNDELIEYAEEHYQNYGAPILLKICQAYNFPVPDDEGLARMAGRLPCRDDCDEGCAK